MRLAAQAKGGYYPTPDRVVDLIAELIHTPTGSYHRGRETLRILDPCCGAGDALERLAERLDRPNALSIETYGVELHRDRAEEAEKRAPPHPGLGPVRHLHSERGLRPAAASIRRMTSIRKTRRTEHAFLTQTTRYLAESGLLVFIVPRQRLAVSARYLSTHYGRMRCWAFPDPEREVFDQVVLMGYRKADPVPDATAESMVLEWAVGEPEPLRSQRHSYSHPEYSPRPPRRPATSCSPPAPSTRPRLLPRRGGRGSGPARRSPTPCGPRATAAPARSCLSDGGTWRCWWRTPRRRRSTARS